MCELTLMLFTIAMTMISNRSATKTIPINICLNLNIVDDITLTSLVWTSYCWT